MPNDIFDHSRPKFNTIQDNTNLDNLYSSVKQKELRIVSEYNGFLNGIPLMSIVAVNASRKVWAGSYGKHISITSLLQGLLMITRWELLLERGLEVLFGEVQ